MQTARVVCVASGKGGTGKSILATNLASIRAARGERVCLLDFDAGMANAHLLLGINPEHDLADVMDGRISARDTLATGPNGLRLLCGGVGRSQLVNPGRKDLDKLFRALEPLERAFDLIVIDQGAGMTYASLAQIAAASVLILVTNHEVTALSDGYALYKRAYAVNPHLRVGLVLNRVPDLGTARAAWERFRGVSHRFLGTTPEWIGWVPADEAVGRSVQHRAPVSQLAPTSAAAAALRGVAEWKALDSARTARTFFERAREALR